MSILEGSVVYIDDEYADEEKDAGRFYKQLWDAGRPIRPYKDIPPDDHLEHWDGLAMVVLDWNLIDSEIRQSGAAAALEESARKKMIKFLGALLARYYCPVFIVSATGNDKIEEALRESEGFPTEALGPRVRIVHKSDVGDDFLKRLEAEVDADPVLSLLRVWEQQYQRAKNRMFIEFSAMAPNWPAYIVKVTSKDGADPASELMEVLYANLRHRVDPVAFDHDRLLTYAGTSSGETLRRVSQGRTMLPNTSLSDRMVYPGDLFKLDPKSPDEVWMNVSPVCQTVPRQEKDENGQDKVDEKGAPVLKQVKLHLLRGVRWGTPPLTKTQFDKLKTKSDGPNGVAIHTLLDGSPYYFDFGDAQIRDWDDVKKLRVGRLLPPFVTRVQQKHAGYIQTEGLPAVWLEMYQEDV